MHVYYIINDSVSRPDWATTQLCLQNLLFCFPNAEIDIIADSVETKMLNAISDCLKDRPYEFHDQRSRIECFLFAIELAARLKTEDICYFVESFYLHINGRSIFGRHDPTAVLTDALNAGEYVSLYDEPEKHFQNFCAGEVCNVVRTPSWQFKRTKYLPLTFAAKSSTVRIDQNVFEENALVAPSISHTHLFSDLEKNRRRILLSALPSLAAPMIDTSFKGDYFDPLTLPWVPYARSLAMR